ncbi:MAG: TolC family protein [Spirochaetota bacterium]
MKQTTGIIIIMTLIGPAMLSAGETGKSGNNKETLTYESYLEQVQAKLPEIKTNLLQVKKSENTLNRAKKVHDTTLTGSTQYYRQKEYTTGATIFDIDHTEGYNAYTGIERIIAPTGTRISAGINYSQTSMKGTLSSQPQSVTYDTYQPSVTASITQPLLNNAFGILDRYAENDALMKLEIQKLQREEDDRSVMNYYRKLYFDWLFFTRAAEIMAETINNALSLESTVRRKARAGLAENDDIQNAHSSVLQYKTQLEQYRMQLNSIEKELGIYIEMEKYRSDRKQMEEMFQRAVEYNYSTVSYDTTTTSQILRKNIEKMKYSLGVKQNSSLPSLNLVGSVTRKNYDETFSGATEQLDDTDYSIGFEFSYPLGNHNAEADIEEARLALEELEKQHQSSANSYLKRLNSLLESVEGYRQVIQTREENLNTLKSQLQTERKKYAQARLDLQYLIATENSIASERLTILEQQLQIIGLYIDYRDLTK